MADVGLACLASLSKIELRMNRNMMMDEIVQYLGNDAAKKLRVLDLSNNMMSKLSLLGVLHRLRVLALEELQLNDQNFGSEPSEVLCCLVEQSTHDGGFGTIKKLGLRNCCLV